MSEETSKEFFESVLGPRCLIIMDTEGEVHEKAVEVDCLITEDTVANGKIHEPIHRSR